MKQKYVNVFNILFSLVAFCLEIYVKELVFENSFRKLLYSISLFINPSIYVCVYLAYLVLIYLF